MKLSQLKRTFAILVVFTLVFSLIIPTKAEDTNQEVFDVNNISLDVEGEFLATKDNKDEVKITLDVTNNSDVDGSFASLKAKLPNDAEFVKSDDFIERDNHDIVLENQNIKANDTKTYAYVLSVDKDSKQAMSWYIDGNQVKKIDSLDDILVNKDERDQAYKDAQQTQEENKDEPTQTSGKKVQSKKITPRGASEEGIFTTENFVTKATVVVDGATITVTTDYYGDVPSKLIVEKVDMTFPYKIAHKQLTNGLGYKISVLDEQGNLF